MADYPDLTPDPLTAAAQLAVEAMRAALPLIALQPRRLVLEAAATSLAEALEETP